MIFEKNSLTAILLLLLIISTCMCTNVAMGSFQTSQTILTSGVIQQAPILSYSYTLIVSGSDYLMINGITGEIDFQSTSATLVINNAIGNLTQGGSILFKAGTYNLDSSITAFKKNSIMLDFEQGALLLVSDGMNAPALKLEHCNNWQIQNIAIDGNAVNQPDASGTEGSNLPQDGIWISPNSNNNIIDRAYITNIGRFGVNIMGVEGAPSTGNKVTNSLFTYNRWNGISFHGSHTIDNIAENNEVSHSGDVGITSYGYSNTIRSNYIHNMDGAQGFNNARIGIAIEGGDNNIIALNIITHCFKGVALSNWGGVEFGTAGSNFVTLNEISDCSYGIWFQSANNTITENRISQYAPGGKAITLPDDYGAPDNSNNLISGNQIISTNSKAHAIYLASANNNQIINNIINASLIDSLGIEIKSGNNNRIELNQISGTKGIKINVGVTNTLICENMLSSCTYPIEDLGTSTSIY